MVWRGMRVEVVASGDDGWCRVGGDSGSDGCRVKKSAPKAGTSLYKATGASRKRLEPRQLRASVFGGYEDLASPRSEALGEQVELWGHSLQEGSGVRVGGGTSSSSNTPPSSGDGDRDGAAPVLPRIPGGDPDTLLEPG